MTPSAIQFNARKNGRPVAARRLDAVALCPNLFSLATASPWPLPEPRRGVCARRRSGTLGLPLRGVQGLARRGSCQLLGRHKFLVAPSGRRWLWADALASSVLRKNRFTSGAIHKHNGSSALIASQALSGVAGFTAPFNRPPLVRFQCFHCFSHSRPFCLFLSSGHSLTANRFPVNRKNENNFAGAEAPTQNPRLDRRLRKAPSTNSITPFPPSAPGRAQPGGRINPRIHRTS
jgi:hypothetical protein